MLGVKSDPEKLTDEGQPGTARLEQFSDNVMSIILTVMVLSIVIPADAMAPGFWKGLVAPFGPKLAAYAFSFLTIGILWVNHHQLLPTAPKSTPSLIWWNNNLLFWMSLIPIATNYLGEQPMLPVAVALYAMVQCAVSLSFALLRHHIARQRQEHRPTLSHHRRIILRSWIGAAVNLASAGLAFVSAPLALAILVIVPAMFFMPARLPPGAVVEG